MPETVTVPPPYTTSGKMAPETIEANTPEPVEFTEAEAFDDVALDMFATDTGASCDGIAIICKTFGWLLAKASVGLLKLTKTMQLDGDKSFETTIMI